MLYRGDMWDKYFITKESVTMLTYSTCFPWFFKTFCIFSLLLVFQLIEPGWWDCRVMKKKYSRGWWWEHPHTRGEKLDGQMTGTSSSTAFGFCVKFSVIFHRYLMRYHSLCLCTKKSLGHLVSPIYKTCHVV